jgi:putative oxidoreductase
MLSSLNRLQPFGALVGRLVLGVILVTHGYGKIIPKGALYGFTQFVGHLGMPPWLGYVAAFTEFFGGMLLILGLLTRIAALGAAIDMGVAVVRVHLHNGLTGHNGQGGFEFPLALFALSLILVFAGAGLLSIDQAIGRGKL